MSAQRIHTVVAGFALPFLVALVAVPGGCKGDAPTTAPKAAPATGNGATAAKAVVPGAGDGATAAAPAAPATAGGAQAEAAAEVPTTPVPKPDGATAAPPTTDAKREVLGSAYIDAYCAQRAGETEKLLDIYTKYGFEEPKQWTEAWTEAAKDSAWVAQITQDAIRKCP